MCIAMPEYFGYKGEQRTGAGVAGCGVKRGGFLREEKNAAHLYADAGGNSSLRN